MKTEITGNRFVRNIQQELKITNLGKVNVFFGKNGTGKSTFLRNIYQSQSNDFHLVVPERGGGNMLYHSNIFDQENKENERKSVRSRNYDSQYRERSISRTVAITQSVGYKTLKKTPIGEIDAETIEALFSVFLPEFTAKFSENQPYSIEFYRNEESGGVKITDTNQLSSGQVEALSLAADIVTQAVLWKNESKCILIDEPDAHLHLDLQNRFAIFIEEIANKFDVKFIITTHSQALMAALMNVCDSIGIVCLDNKNKEIKAIQKNSDFIFSNLLSSDLALSKVLGRKIMIVEGNDDFLVWNQATRNQNFEDVAIIEAGGSNIVQYKNYTEKILNAISDDNTQAGITLTDRDKKNDAIHDVDSILPIKRLQCYSVENLFLSNEVLQSIKADVNLVVVLDALSVENPSDKDVIDEIKKDKKSTKISKDLIKKIHFKIDDHSDTTDWRIRVGKMLGKERPTGELLDFIGEDVVTYVWGDAVETVEE
jgi:predicted ATP-dependent endonuclease of OLD family